MLTLSLWKVPDISTVIQAAQAANKARGVQEIGRRILRPAVTAFGGRRRRRRVGRAAGHCCSRAKGSTRNCAGVPRAGRHRRPGRSGAGRHDEGAAAGGLSPRPGPPRLRRPGGAARIDGSGGRQHLHGRHGADGTNNDDWIAADHVVRAQQLRQHGRLSPPPTSRECGPRRRPQDGVDRRRTRSDAARLLAVAADMDGDGESQPRRCAANALGTGTWTTGDPQQAGMWFQIELPTASPITEIQFTSPPGVGGRRRRRHPPRPARRWRALGPGFDGRKHVECARGRRSGLRQADDDCIQAGRGEVRPDHANRYGRDRTAVDSPGSAPCISCRSARRRRATTRATRSAGLQACSSGARAGLKACATWNSSKRAVIMFAASQ